MPSQNIMCIGSMSKVRASWVFFKCIFFVMDPLASVCQSWSSYSKLKATFLTFSSDHYGVWFGFLTKKAKLTFSDLFFSVLM